MAAIDGLFRLADRLKAPRVAHAHCDVPCGIYDPASAQIAAKTVLTMVKKIKDLQVPTNGSKDEQLAFQNTVTRMITTKEQHAELCKRELQILWSDFFKPEDLDQFPDLHTTFWNALKLASRNKQNVDLQAAEELVAAVDKIAEMFWKNPRSGAAAVVKPAGVS